MRGTALHSSAVVHVRACGAVSGICLNPCTQGHSPVILYLRQHVSWKPGENISIPPSQHRALARQAPACISPRTCIHARPHNSRSPRALLRARGIPMRAAIQPLSHRRKRARHSDMCKQRGGGRRGRRGSGVPLPAAALLLSSLVLAYVAWSRSFTDLPHLYRLAVGAVDERGASLAPGRAHVELARPRDTEGWGEVRGEERAEERAGEGSEGGEEGHGESRLERDRRRRRARIASVHVRVAEKRKAPATAAANVTGVVGAAPPPTRSGTRGTGGGGGKKAAAGKKKRARVAEFRGARGGTVDGMVRGQNVTRVSYTVYKIMKLFGFASVTDSPAGAHAEWMREVVRRMAYDAPFFRYVAVDRDEKGLGRARRATSEVVDGEYVVADVEKEMPRSTEVVLHWTELDGSERDARSREYVRHVARVMRAAKAKGCGYFVTGQFPRLNGPSPAFRKGKWGFVGTDEEEPFLFNDHVRGVVPMGAGGKAYMLYLTFYSLKSIPAEALEAVV